MQVQATPLVVQMLAPEKLFYQEWDFWVSIGTMLLALATIWLALETRRMRRGSDKAMGELAKHAENAAKASLEQAKDTRTALEIATRNAAASERLAEANETLAISGYRGWLVVVKAPFSTVHNSDGGVTVVGGVHFRNCGRTPCSGIGARHCVSFLPQQPMGFADDGGHTNFAVVAPDEEVTILFKHTFNATEFQQLQSKAKTLYIYGNLHYTDVFGYGRGTYWRFEYHYGRNAAEGERLFPCDDGNKFE